LLRRQKNRPDLPGLDKHILLLFLACLCLLTQAGLTWARPLPDLPRDKLINPDDITKGFEQGQTTVKVIVNLAEPLETLAAMNWRSRPSLNALHAEVLTRQQKVLNTLATGEFKLRRRFENQAAFSAEVTLEGLRKLSNNPMVESIEPVYLLQLHLAQGIPLINGSVYRSTYNGQGVAIAVCDTGIDYNHPKLGGGGFPNSKVIGGYDFGDNDDDPIPQSIAHGTCCAGIAAGNLGTTGNYIGGVAYNSMLYALKVADSSGNIADDDIISAWDWCVSHKDDDPCHPILVISNSFGGGRYYSAATAESVESSLATAANNAVAAGITILASSGNDGYCDSMASPAAFSSVISVGAVYDAGFGTWKPCVSSASCATKYSMTECTGWYAIDATAQDMVTSYSNTASFLSILAPSNQAYTTDISGSSGYSSGDYYSSFGGTSAACPYAAGAVACLQSAAKAIRGGYLTPTEVKTFLTSTGDDVADGKVAITKPRVNLGQAIDSLYTPPGSVAIRGSWVTGTTHTKESGTNRALIFIAHAERNSSLAVSSVSYGGQPMMKIIDVNAGTTSRVYVAAYQLGESGISAATDGNFVVGWSNSPSSFAYSSVFLSDVNQTALIGASAIAAIINGTSLSTSALSTKDGDMVIDAATCSNTGDYTVNNGFTEAIEHSMSSADGVDGYKSATGADETPSVTHSVSGRQALIGFVVQALGTATPVTIYGHVLEADGNTPVEGVLMQTDDNDVNSVTDANGFYELLVDSNWSGIVTPQKEGYVFDPNKHTYANVTQDYNDVNYTATLTTFKIAGYVLEPNYVTPINDVNVSAENGGGQWTSRYGGWASLTDVNGYYEIRVDYNWWGKVMPAKRAYVFEPNSRYYEDVNEDYTADQNYTGVLLPYRIAGYIKNECNAPVGSVLVDADNNGCDTITDANGYYEVWVDYNWSGMVTPAKQHYTFAPGWMSYVDVLADLHDQNYIAGNTCDLDCDGYIGLNDFTLMAHNWLATGSDILGDLDASGRVDFFDFAEFGLAW
jgi:subtilisin family serine protease